MAHTHLFCLYSELFVDQSLFAARDLFAAQDFSMVPMPKHHPLNTWECLGWLWVGCCGPNPIFFVCCSECLFAAWFVHLFAAVCCCLLLGPSPALWAKMRWHY